MIQPVYWCTKCELS